ncbi:hypothetical protein QBC41DRAFT_56027 [Cercophora samala]|uniref:Uncharacterized protein n=1 Tax=Cercophora samala TaxID=330535 RepID=A0AA39ZHZ0_9PEZI|nr:hypothetical protein QBC41DRAFT_56027 [Cercophora samala]
MIHRLDDGWVARNTSKNVSKLFRDLCFPSPQKSKSFSATISSFLKGSASETQPTHQTGRKGLTYLLQPPNKNNNSLPKASPLLHSRSHHVSPLTASFLAFSDKYLANSQPVVIDRAPVSAKTTTHSQVVLVYPLCARESVSSPPGIKRGEGDVSMHMHTHRQPAFVPSLTGHYVQYTYPSWKKDQTKFQPCQRGGTPCVCVLD